MSGYIYTGPPGGPYQCSRTNKRGTVAWTSPDGESWVRADGTKEPTEETDPPDLDRDKIQSDNLATYWGDWYASTGRYSEKGTP